MENNESYKQNESISGWAHDRGRDGGSVSLHMGSTRGVEVESRTEVVNELADFESLEDSEFLSNGWRHRGSDVVNDSPCDRNRAFQDRGGIGILLATPATSFTTSPVLAKVGAGCHRTRVIFLTRRSWLPWDRGDGRRQGCCD